MGGEGAPLSRFGTQQHVESECALVHLGSRIELGNCPYRLSHIAQDIEAQILRVGIIVSTVPLVLHEHELICEIANLYWKLADILRCFDTGILRPHVLANDTFGAMPLDYELSVKHLPVGWHSTAQACGTLHSRPR